MAYRNSRPLFQGIMSLALTLGAGLSASSQTATTQSVPATSASAPAAQASSSSSAADSTTPLVRRRRTRRRYVQPTTPQAATSPQTVGPTPEQRTRDAQILAAQKAQSAEIARQNAITTGKVVKEREAQQAEPRIQDAPGTGSQPLAGDPAVQPAQSGDAPRIQDAPGPAQTLPQAPPAQPAPPAPQETAPQNRVF